MKMFYFKYQQNRTIDKYFDFLKGEGAKGIPNYKLNYYWQTYEIILFQISAKSNHK